MDKETTKRCENAMKDLAGNPSEKELKGLRIFGMPAMQFNKKTLIYALIMLSRKLEEQSKEHIRQLDFLTSLRP